MDFQGCLINRNTIKGRVYYKSTCAATASTSWNGGNGLTITTSNATNSYINYVVGGGVDGGRYIVNAATGTYSMTLSDIPDEYSCCGAGCPAKTGVAVPVKGKDFYLTFTPPTITSVVSKCAQTPNTTITWEYASSSTASAFFIKDYNATVASAIPHIPGTNPYSTDINLSAGAHSIKVCVGNGVYSACSAAIPVAALRTLAPPLPVPTYTFAPDASCPDKYIVSMAWDEVSNAACEGGTRDPLHALPYWSQASATSGFATNDFPINTWGSYTSQTTSVSYPPQTTVYAHVQSRDVNDLQSGWSATENVVIPSPSPYPTIHIEGNFSEDVGLQLKQKTCSKNRSRFNVQIKKEALT
jgi:hypothetical protein